MISYHTHGGDVYRHQNVTDFSANCNPFGTPESVKEAVARAMDQVCHYPDVECERLREAISRYEETPQGRTKPRIQLCADHALYHYAAGI